MTSAASNVAKTLMAASFLIDVLPAGTMKENTVLISDVLIQKQHNQTVDQNPIDFLFTEISRIFPPPRRQLLSILSPPFGNKSEKLL